MNIEDEQTQNQEIEQWNKQREETIKKNWKELEEWNVLQEKNVMQKYGADLTKLDTQKSTKRIDKIAKILNKFVKAILVLHVIIIISLILIVVIFYMGIRQMQT